MSRLMYIRNNTLVVEDGYSSGACNFVHQPIDSILTRAGWFIPIDPTAVPLTDWLDGGNRPRPLANQLYTQGLVITPQGICYVVRRIEVDKEPVHYVCERLYLSKHWHDLSYEYASRRATMLVLLRLNRPKQACEIYSRTIHETHYEGWWRVASIRSMAARAAKLGATGEIPDVLWAHEKPKSE